MYKHSLCLAIVGFVYVRRFFRYSAWVCGKKAVWNIPTNVTGLAVISEYDEVTMKVIIIKRYCFAKSSAEAASSLRD